MTNEKIHPNRFYNLTELLPYIPWIKSLPTLANLVDADMKTENNLKAIKVGSGSGARYHIKGENIIKFLAKAESEGLNLSPLEGGDDENV
jgi:hypothetical protein